MRVVGTRSGASRARVKHPLGSIITRSMNCSARTMTHHSIYPTWMRATSPILRQSVNMFYSHCYDLHRFFSTFCCTFSIIYVSSYLYSICRIWFCTFFIGFCIFYLFLFLLFFLFRCVFVERVSFDFKMKYFNQNSPNHSVSAEDEVVSIGDSVSDNDTDENRHSSGENHNSKNGYEHSTKKQKMVFIQPQFAYLFANF